MKHLAHIAIALTTLIVTLFGAGGVGLMTCACSGETTLVVPMDDGCCGADTSCMTVRVVQLSEGETVTTLLAPLSAHESEVGSWQLAALPAFHPLLSALHSPRCVQGAPLSTLHSPPPSRLSMVMRV